MIFLGEDVIIMIDSQLNKITNYIKSNVSFIFLEGYELYVPSLIQKINTPTRFFNDIFYVGKDKNLSTDMDEILSSDLNDIRYLANEFIKKTEDKNILIVAQGFDYLFNEQNYQLKEFISLLYQIATENINTSKFENQGRRFTIIFTGSNYKIPREIKDYSIRFQKSFPDLNEINCLIEQFKEIHLPTKELAKQLQNNNLSEKLQGLNDKQIVQTLSLLYRRFGPMLFSNKVRNLNNNINDKLEEELNDIKKQQIEKTDTLSILNTDIDLKKNVKGLKNLKRYIEMQKSAFKNIPKLENSNISLPKGILLLGKPGNGKSLSAKAIANTLDLPLIAFDISKILGQYVGQSESKMQEVLETVQSMSPCVLWIDEIEKALSGANNKDNDVMRKVIGIFLTWMSDKNKGVFVVATANNVKNQLPPELTRKGRFDKIFYIDNPNFQAKKAIFELHLTNRLPLNLSDYREWEIKIFNVLKQKQFSGAEIEYCCNEGVKKAILEINTINDDQKNLLKEKALQSIYNEMKKIIVSIDQDSSSYADLRRKVENKFEDEIFELTKIYKDNFERLSIIEQTFAKNLERSISNNVQNEISNFQNEKENRTLFESAD